MYMATNTPQGWVTFPPDKGDKLILKQKGPKLNKLIVDQSNLFNPTDILRFQGSNGFRTNDEENNENDEKTWQLALWRKVERGNYEENNVAPKDITRIQPCFLILL